MAAFNPGDRVRLVSGERKVAESHGFPVAGTVQRVSKDGASAWVGMDGREGVNRWAAGSLERLSPEEDGERLNVAVLDRRIALLRAELADAERDRAEAAALLSR